MAGSETKLLYEFTGFRLDPQKRLLAGPDGQPIPMPPRVLDTLLFFVERRGELLDKHTLMKAIWPQSVVEENSLNQNIAAIRRVLGERPREHRFIVTEPGRGYRFVADVQVVRGARADAPAPDRPDTPAPPSTSTTRSNVRNSIAVLPFANLTGDPDKEYFGDGLAEELIHTLARIPGLRVPSRTSSFAYKGRNIDLRQIAEELKVSAVLEGSVRSAGERIRITAQLIDGETGYHLWSEHFDRRFEDLFELQDELARAIIVQTLIVTVHGYGSAEASLVRRPPTLDLEAYRLYMQALSDQVRIGFGTRLAFDKLQLAIRRDPAFTQARTALVALRALAIIADVPLPGTLAEAEFEAREALAVAPDTGATYAALGIIHAAQARWVEAEDDFQRAVALDEQDPWVHQNYGVHLLGSVGHLHRYQSAALEAHRLAPAWVVNALNLTVVETVLGNDAQARLHAEMALDLGLPRTSFPLVDVLSQLAARARRYDEGSALMVEAMAVSNRAARTTDVVNQVFAAFADPRERSRAVAALDTLRQDLGSGGLNNMLRRRFLIWYSMLGAVDQAYEMIAGSLDGFARSGTIGTAWNLLWMPELEGWRDDLRFAALCDRMKLPDYWDRYGPPDGYQWRDRRLCRP